LTCDLLDELRDLRLVVVAGRDKRLRRWAHVVGDGPFRARVDNLAAYLALRSVDIRSIQLRLADLGMSSLGRSQAHVLATIEAVIGLLEDGSGRVGGVIAASDSASAAMERVSTAMFGGPSQRRSTRIMVTLPAQAAEDPALVQALVDAGMDCARINCGHDDLATWSAMASNVRKAADASGRQCTVLADLSGPRLRTGPMEPAPPVIHLRPRRDVRGMVVAPAKVVLDASGALGARASRREGLEVPARIAVARGWLDQLEPGGTVEVVDIPGRHRKMLVGGRGSDSEVVAEAWEACYLEPGSVLKYRSPSGDIELTEVVGPVGERPASFRVHRGDLVVLSAADRPGHSGSVGPDGSPVPAGIPTLVADVLDDLHPGERVLIDDGAIEARVRSIDPDGALLEVVLAGRRGTKVKAEKGLNFPDSQLHLPALTDEDLVALDAVVHFADVVGYSFVRDAADMDRLVDELAERGAEEIGILAKIETPEAVSNLPEIIVHGAARHHFGVMIARGDLAIEVGFERLAEVQEEILWLCEAAQVPVVWATQVLDQLVVTGVPSRSEITDAAVADRADCVMLNKGPFQVLGVETLHELLVRTAGRHRGPTELFPLLPWDSGT